MRTAILALCVCGVFAWSGAAAFGQSAPAGPLSPNPPRPSLWTELGREFGKLPPGSTGTAKAPPGIVVRPALAPRAPLGNASIDPKMILHPTARDLGTQPPGILVAQNLYPGLKFQPIDAQPCGPKGGLLSTTWPKLKVEPIPITWPNAKMKPVGSDAGPAASSTGR